MAWHPHPEIALTQVIFKILLRGCNLGGDGGEGGEGYRRAAALAASWAFRSVVVTSVRPRNISSK